MGEERGGLGWESKYEGDGEKRWRRKAVGSRDRGGGMGAADGWMGWARGEGKKNWMGRRTGREKGQVGVSDGFQGVSGNGRKPWADWKGED